MPRFDTPLHTNDQSISRVLGAGLPVLLVIWRDRLDSSLEETLRQIARNDAGRVLVAQLDAADNPRTAQRASGPLPALITFRDGQIVTQASGITSATAREHVNFLLGRGPHPQEGPVFTAPRTDPVRALSEPVTVSDASFRRDVLESELPVLVDLWAPWCGPCRMIAPVVEKLAKEYAGRLKVAKLNVDENPATANAYHVQGIPTLLIFRNGRVVDRIVGAAPEPLLRGKVDAALRSA